LSFIKSQSSVTRLVDAYRELGIALHFTHGFRIVPFDLRAAKTFTALKRPRIRIGTQNLKIAAMVLANDATLLSRNLQDFTKVPGVKVQNWLE
jgi:tRNA(fMet)-specific endonuclease VapC